MLTTFGQGDCILWQTVDQDSWNQTRAISSSGGTTPRPLLMDLQPILPSVNPTKRQLGEQVLEDPEGVPSFHLGRASWFWGRVSWIVGFCRTPGVDGFADFKISLARELTRRVLSAALDAIEAQPTKPPLGNKSTMVTNSCLLFSRP